MFNYFEANLFWKRCIKFHQNRPSFIEDIAKITFWSLFVWTLAITEWYYVIIGQGRSQRGPGGACTPIVDWVDFYGKKLALLGRRACVSLYQKCYVGLKYAQMRWRPGPL